MKGKSKSLVILVNSTTTKNSNWGCCTYICRDSDFILSFHTLLFMGMEMSDNEFEAMGNKDKTESQHIMTYIIMYKTSFPPCLMSLGKHFSHCQIRKFNREFLMSGSVSIYDQVFLKGETWKRKIREY